MGKLQIMSAQSGHDTLPFDKADVLSVREAEKRFNELVREQGWLASTRLADGSHVQTRAFNPEDETVTLWPPCVSG